LFILTYGEDENQTRWDFANSYNTFEKAPWLFFEIYLCTSNFSKKRFFVKIEFTEVKLPAWWFLKQIADQVTTTHNYTLTLQSKTGQEK